MKVCFYVFFVLIVDFNYNIDELYVVFGFERNDWNCKEEGFMKFCRLNRYVIYLLMDLSFFKDK